MKAAFNHHSSRHITAAVTVSRSVLRSYCRRPLSPVRPRSWPFPSLWQRNAIVRHYSALSVAASTEQGEAGQAIEPANTIRKSLPITCPGCGALSQDELKHEAGYYSPKRKAVQDYLSETSVRGLLLQDENIDHLVKSSKSDSAPAQHDLPIMPTKTPYCDRCHDLVHHNRGISIAHPSLADIELTINESPHDTNHIWHVVDAADFPMSIVLDLDKRLSLAYLRPRNRRSKDTKYVSGRPANMNFIITRSDLLAPKKEMVDRLVPRLRTILRSALGSHGDQTRLGNIHIVSADRGWWTKSVKAKLLQDPGAHWLVGKVNVGKSKLFETIFPKGTNKKLGSLPQQNTLSLPGSKMAAWQSSTTTSTHASSSGHNINDTFNMLSPVQAATQYPVMPVISSLPGTTVSPIRIPYFDGRCELIDLPGLRRASLEEFVQTDEKDSLIMTDRVVPEKIVIKPGQSLLLGGLVRFTAARGDHIIMAHAFTPLKTHLTSNLKAEAMHTGQIDSSAIGNISLPEARQTMQSAGTFKLQDDVTRVYAGPLTRKDAVSLKPERLPFSIFATDILLEGVGWIELQVQVRKPKSPAVERQLQQPLQQLDENHVLRPPIDGIEALNVQYPEVEVFSPHGKFIGQRQTLCAFAHGGPKSQKKTARPRRSMVSVKNQRRTQISPITP